MDWYATYFLLSLFRYIFSGVAQQKIPRGVLFLDLLFSLRGITPLLTLTASNPLATR